jgi:hypothetical protein
LNLTPECEQYKSLVWFWLVFYELIILIAFCGQARVHSPQARQAKGSVIGMEYRSSCWISLEGQASTAAHKPSAQSSGRHN